MMFKRSLTILAGMMLLGNTAGASSFELNFNDDSAQARLGVTLSADEYGQSLLTARVLYNEDHEDAQFWLTSAGAAFLGEPGGLPGLTLGVGAELNGGKVRHVNLDIINLAVGGIVSFYPPALQGLGMGARLFYAPRIFSFEECERMLEGSVRLGYQFTPRLGVRVEFQKMRIDFERYGWEDADEELRLGFEAKF